LIVCHLSVNKIENQDSPAKFKATYGIVSAPNQAILKLIKKLYSNTKSKQNRFDLAAVTSPNAQVNPHEM